MSIKRRAGKVLFRSCSAKKVSEYDQEIPQSHTADQSSYISFLEYKCMA